MEAVQDSGHLLLSQVTELRPGVEGVDEDGLEEVEVGGGDSRRLRDIQ